MKAIFPSSNPDFNLRYVPLTAAQVPPPISFPKDVSGLMDERPPAPPPGGQRPCQARQVISGF